MRLQIAPSLHERNQMLAPARVGMADVQSVEKSGRTDGSGKRRARPGRLVTAASVPTTKQDADARW